MPGSSNSPQGGSPPVLLAPSVPQFPKGDPRNCIKEGDTNINIMQVSTSWEGWRSGGGLRIFVIWRARLVGAYFF